MDALSSRTPSTQTLAQTRVQIGMVGWRTSSRSETKRVSVALSSVWKGRRVNPLHHRTVSLTWVAGPLRFGVG